MPGHTGGMRPAPSLSQAAQEPRAVGTGMAQVAGSFEGSDGPGGRAELPRLPVPAFAEVYEAHFEFVWRSARRLGVFDAALDDVVQDVFVTVYRRLGEFEGRSQLKTWIFGILRHHVRDMRRSMQRKPTEALATEPLDGSDGPHECALRQQGTKLLHHLLGTLDDDLREVFVLAELEQMSVPEIASALSANVNTVYSRLRTARQEFDAALKRAQKRDEWRMR
jgi:RNA polymerase sigma-70 factor (ECF subfamily)